MDYPQLDACQQEPLPPVSPSAYRLSFLSRACSSRSISTRYSASFPGVGRGSQAAIRTMVIPVDYTGNPARDGVTSLQRRVGRDHRRVSGIARVRLESDRGMGSARRYQPATKRYLTERRL